MTVIARENFERGGFGRSLRTASPRPPLHTPTPLSTSPPSVLRKGSCACGGGCPTCQEKEQLQAKLDVSHPGDAYEREADAVAEHVLGMPAAGRARGAAAKHGAGMNGSAEMNGSVEGAGGGLRVSRRAARSSPPSSHVSGAPPSVNQVLRAAGEPLDPSARDFFEPRFMHDFGSVRVHANGEAADSAREIRARAYTVGNHIVFGAGEYAPTSEAGRHLLAHELAHTIQQGDSAPHADAESGGARDSAAVAPQRTHALRLQRTPAPLIQRVPTDATFEAGSGVGPAITARTMTTDAAVHNQTISANDCFGRTGCNLSFRFEKAYKGDYNYVGGGGQAVRGVYVKIVASYASAACGPCNELRLLQVFRNTTQTGGSMVTADPGGATRRARGGWGDPAAPSRGWAVDRVDSATNPYYASSLPGSSWSAQPGSATTPARLWDAPGDWATTTNAGSEFQTCMICSPASGASTVLGCVTWGYYINSAGAIAFRPSPPTAACGTSTPVTDATQRWDRIPGNTKANIDFAHNPPAPAAAPTTPPARR